MWAVRSAADATWAVTGPGKGITDDANVHIYLTGDVLGTVNGISGDGGGGGSPPEVEMSTLRRDFRSGGAFVASQNRKRPDLKKIVDDTFRHGSEDRVAVLVCGPQEMAADLRHYVRAWV